MAVDTNNLASLFEKLKPEDPWLPPRPWESIPSQSGLSHSQFQSQSHSSQEEHLFDTSSVSESSLVRLALNALQGVESAVISIEKLSAAFCSDAADRSFHRITSLWNHISSTHALGKILKDIGFSGCLVLLLRKFVEHFTNLNLDDKLVTRAGVNNEASGNENFSGNGVRKDGHLPYSLVNQAFSVAVAKILDGYIFSLDTLYASIGFRRSLGGKNCPLDASSGVGCLSSAVFSDISLLEVYLHTVELRTRIEAVVNICKLHDVALCFSVSSFEEVLAKAAMEFSSFPIGGDLLTYLFEQLKVADPTHYRLLKFLFLRSCEPYFVLVRSWIYQAEINDPYEEFVVECADESTCDQGGTSCFPMKKVLVRDRVATPCFLKESLIPLIRAGQQLHVLMKLLEFYDYDAVGGTNLDDFLPSWKGFSCDPLSPSSPLTFSLESIQVLVHARDNYYAKMQENLEKFWVKLKVKNQEASPCSNLPFIDGWGNSGRAGSSFAPVTVENKGLNWVAGNIDPNDDLRVKEYSQLEDVYGSDDCSSSYTSDEQIESEELVESATHFACVEQKYLSALKFSLDTHVGSAVENRVSKGEETLLHVDFRHKHLHGADLSFPHSEQGQFHYAFPPQKEELSQYSLLKRRCSNISPVKDPKEIPMQCRLHLSDFGTKTGKRNAKICGSMMPSVKKFPPLDAHEEAVVENEHCTIDDDHSSLLKLQPLNYLCHSNLLSLNPMLTKNAFTRSKDKPREKNINYPGRLLPYFDFSSVNNPLKVCEEKLAALSIHECGSQLDLPMCIRDSASGNKLSCIVEKVIDLDSIVLDNSNEPHEDAPSAYISGGNGWESMLASCRSSITSTGVRDDEEHLIEKFEMPVDLAVEKCILQEITLQYCFVSKLTIKFLEEGFDLQQHLLALRRFFFMEVADWADMFIMSLLKHKKLIAEAGQRIPDIQALLEIAIQRSSCEHDRNKQRLFVYFKGQEMASQSTYLTAIAGIHCLEFLGLGYRVNWPVDIILTQAALKIYSEIFDFLIKVRLAAFALTDIWSLLKDLRHSINQNCQSELHKQKVNHFRILLKLRNQLNHFVSMLQQYVHSQLSHVSWCKFLHSLQHKVKDMMDLESVHMDYLSNCLEICFLSNEMRTVGSVIRNALQCALDFQFCLNGGARENFFGNISAIIIPQVQEIRQRFEKNMSDLHLIYLRSPKHGKFGLSCFWHHLNYNKYYAEDSNQYALS